MGSVTGSEPASTVPARSVASPASCALRAENSSATMMAAAVMTIARGTSREVDQRPSASGFGTAGSCAPGIPASLAPPACSTTAFS